MQVAFGWKAHSGWAALVVLGHANGTPVVVDRRRVELVSEEWEKQPYHAAEDLDPTLAKDLVRRGVSSARRIAAREVRAAVARERTRGNAVLACAVLVGTPMPEWSVEEILAVHLRMHQAEGVLFRDVLARAVTAEGLRLVTIPERTLAAVAEESLGASASATATRQVMALGKVVGAPWGKDQKEAALAALVALVALGDGQRPGARAGARAIARAG